MLLYNTLQATEIRAEMTQEASTDGGIRIAESLSRVRSCCIIAGALA